MSNSPFSVTGTSSGGGAVNKLAVINISSPQNTVDFTNITNAYTSYTIRHFNTYLTANDNLMFLTSSNNGVSYDNSAGNYRWAETGQIDGSSYFPSDSSGNSFIAFTDSFSGYKLTTNVNQTITGTIDIMNPSASLPTQVIFNTGGFFYLNPSNIWAGNFFCVGTRVAATAVNAFRIAPYNNTTQFAGGTFVLYGNL